MCALFGIVDYRGLIGTKQMNKMISVLSRACEVRGTDATGIAYNTRDSLCIHKRPLPAHRMCMRIPYGARVIMGHTRMTTQGNEKHNYNNHPFYGSADTDFALAHNGVLSNDILLQKSENLPDTIIETDSYVAVQLIEKKGELNADSLAFMAEKLRGTFTITVLDRNNNLYFVKGDNPMCIYHCKDKGFYIYASTEEILKSALARLSLRPERFEKVALYCGDILKIDKFGRQTKTEFDVRNLYWYDYPYSFSEPAPTKKHTESSYVRELKFIASGFGYSPECVDYLIEEGFTPDDIEDIFYCG